MFLMKVTSTNDSVSDLDMVSPNIVISVRISLFSFAITRDYILLHEQYQIFITPIEIAGKSAIREIETFQPKKLLTWGWWNCSLNEMCYRQPRYRLVGLKVDVQVK